MIRIIVPADIRKKIEKRHKEYAETVIIPFWNDIVGRNVDGKKVELKEKEDIDLALINKNIEIDSNIFISSDINKYAYTSEELFGCEKDKRVRLVNILLYGLGYNSKFSKVNKVECDSRWNRHELLKMLNIKVCPYCNRQYITSYQREGGAIWSTADIDHYYPKSCFPLLSMNLYNMIPSCNICNSKLKGNRVKGKKDVHLYPYCDESDNMKFNCDEYMLQCYSIGKAKAEDLEIDIVNQGKDEDLEKKVEQSKEIFRLGEVYKVHSNEMVALIDKVKCYDAWFYNKVMNKDYPNVLNGYGELAHMMFDFLSKEEGDEPLIKMKKDIYKQLIT